MFPICHAYRKNLIFLDPWSQIHAKSTNNRLAQEVLYDIANEEKEHAGEFLRLLRELHPEEEKFYKEGYEEVEEMIAKLKK